MQFIDAVVCRFFPTRGRSAHPPSPARALFVAAAGGVPLPAVDFGHEFAIASALLVALVGVGAVAVAIGVKFDAGDDQDRPA